MEDAGRLVTPTCHCHGEPMLRNKRSNQLRCRVKERERFRRMWAARRDRDLAQKRSRYDTDPIYRITKRLGDNERERRQTLQRMKEGTVGTLPHKG